MRTVGIKLADGSFYPIMEEGSAQTKKLELTTANDNQTCVMVDLYRSKTCSMDDAEYIDTLKIENLNAHQNGEPSISFDVGLDENGELSASIADPETGATSNSQITLVSRTAEERLVADDYSIAGEEEIEETSVDEPIVEEAPVEEKDNSGAVAAGVVAGAGLLAAAGIIAANNKKDEEAAEEVVEEPAEEISEEAAEETITEDDFTLGDDTIGAEPEDVAEEDVTVADDASGLVADDTSTDDTLPDMDFDIPEETEANDDFATDNTIADESSGFMADDTLSDDSGDFATDETLADDATIASDDTFDLPDDTTEATDDSFDLPDDTTEASDDSFDLPDDTTIPGDETILEDESFSTPQELTDTSIDDDTDDFFNDIDSEPTPSPSEGLNFTGLYDKETEMGEPSAHEEEDIKKKTRTPVIICIVCAIICIIATILVLLVVPGKFNLRQKHADKKAQTAIEKPAETPAKEEAKPAVEEKKPDPVPQAKENEVVVIEKAEEVKPLPPPAAETKPKAVSYKIKWGDTLWDIADTYYKNPWRYKKIAKYNNIKNPDHIISGTVIQIPAE
jgi:LysM repeat protein